MNPDERAQIRVTVALLRAAEKTYWLSAGLVVLTGASIVFGRGNRAAAIGAVAVGLVATYYWIRIAFDARLLDHILAERLTASDVDQALAAMSLARADRAGRPWTDRCRGAKRLVAIYTAAVAAQTVGVILVGR